MTIGEIIDWNVEAVIRSASSHDSSWNSFHKIGERNFPELESGQRNSQILSDGRVIRREEDNWYLVVDSRGRELHRFRRV